MLERLKGNKKVLILVVAGVVLISLLLLLLILMQGSNNTPNNGTTNPPITNPPVGNTPPPPSNDGSNGGQTPPPADGQILIKWWGAFLSEEDVKPVIDAFEAEHENVEIQYSSQVVANKDVDSYKTKLEDVLGDTSSSNAPDIFMFDNGWTGSLVSYMEPAPDNILNVSQFNADYYQFAETDLIKNQEIYGLPLWVDTLALVYNKDLWAKAGLTQPAANWSKFANDQVPLLTKKNDNNVLTQSGFAAGNTDNSEFWFEAINMLMLQNQVKMVDASGKAVFATNADAEDAVEFYKQFGSTNKSWDTTFNLDVAAFLEGKLATYLAPSWRLKDIVRYNNAADLDLDIGVMEVPQLQSSGSFKSSIAMYWGNSVNAASENTDLSWEFINFINQPEQLELLNQTIVRNNPGNLGIVYPRKDMIGKQSTDKFIGPYANSLAYAQTWFMVDEVAMREAFAPILTEDADLEDVQEEVNLILGQN